MFIVKGVFICSRVFTLVKNQNIIILIYDASVWLDSKMKLKIETSIKREFLSWLEQKKTLKPCGARYSCNNQYTQNYTILFYKGVWVYCIFLYILQNCERYVHCKLGVFSFFCDI